MAIDSLATWKSTLVALPKVADSSWADNFASWVDARVTNKAQLTGIITPTPPFTFSMATFKSQLATLSPTTSASVAATNFANAWATAMNVSLVLTVPPGSSLGAPSPATTWSVVTTALIDVPSVLVAQNYLQAQLAIAPTVADANDSLFAQIFRNTFLLLTGSVTGMNSVPPPVGPLPLIAVAVPLL